jgi:hypothetical protein
MILNLSVWESVESLRAFVYDGDHIAVMRRRREWFERLAELFVVLWWIPEGRPPTIHEAIARLEHLRAHGPSPHAFTFKQRFGPAELAA